MIRLENICFQYGSRIILDNISLNVEKGKCTCIDGPNGCGKSTLFRILNGLEFPSDGKYFLDEERITKEKMKDDLFAKRLHRKIGYLFQDSEMQLFTRSVEDEIAFGLFQLGYSREQVHEKVERFIALLKLEEVRKQAPFNLSGGEKKRCALASILAMEPDILILDEPTNSLDEDGREWIADFLKQLKQQNKTILIATHQKEFIDSIADIVIQMDRYHHIASIVEK